MIRKIEISAVLSDDIKKTVDVVVNGTTLSFKFRKLEKFTDQFGEDITPAVHLPCYNLCKYAGKCEEKIRDPRDLDNDECGFMDLCCDLGEAEEGLIPKEGTIEEEFKKIGVTI